MTAVKSGALGYLLKSTSPNELLDAIRDVFNGRPSMHPAITLTLMQEIHYDARSDSHNETLTGRETEILKLVAQGMTNQDIAAYLFISERTVSTHVSNILDKLHLENRTQAALFALREGLTTLSASY
jgi:NarL family two-component system response regulator LiaR